MKDRLSNVLAWFAFAHGIVCVITLSIASLNDWRVSKPVELYFELVGYGVLEGGVLYYSPLIWVFLYIINGNPRFLPWAK